MEFKTQQPTVKGSPEMFVGDAWYDAIATGADATRMRVSIVRFASGARTAWHAHLRRQTLSRRRQRGTTMAARPAEQDAGGFVFRLDAVGTQWEIETREPLDDRLRQRIVEQSQEFDATYSRFRPNSLVSRVAASPDGGYVHFPDDSAALFDLYDRLHAATGGAVDPLVGRDLELLGYDRKSSLTPAPHSV